MSRTSEILLTDLRHTIADLGRGGGLISPSIYDTAQVIRLAPPAGGAWPAIEWLLARQHPDGGWGNPGLPRARAVPTLAAALALLASTPRRAYHDAARRAIVCLWREAEHWAAPLPDDLPVGVELLFPRLLDEAAAMGVELPVALYHPLVELGRHRRSLLAGARLRPGTTPVHSWEALGAEPDPALLDDAGSVGHSPAATAAWLHAAAGRADLAAQRAAAAAYLERAAAATQGGVPGVVPTAWPIDRFEQVYALHTLLAVGLLDSPELRDVVAPQVAALALSLKADGLGFSDAFTPDGDDTAAALAVLRAWGAPADMRPLEAFAAGDTFCTYRGELQPSLITTARAVHALALAGCNAEPGRAYIVSQQSHDGRWPRDKWNSSWLYTTYQALIALGQSFDPRALRRAVDALLAHQQPDGSWCSVEDARLEETAYGILICRLAVNAGLDGPQLGFARAAAERWLRQHYRPLGERGNRCWLAKESYSPVRVSRVLELAALIPRSS